MNQTHGLLLINKPSGKTSHQVVEGVRKIFNQKKVGHAGTLDPMAEGLMILLLGKACRLSSYLTNFHKRYEVRMKLGQVTDTWDRDGKILKETSKKVGLKKIQETLKNSLGEVTLPVPAFSAVKVRGKKLYQYARKKEEVPIVQRDMHFYDLKILEILEDQVRLEISCFKGNYVRSWTHWIGEQLQIGAHLFGLIRQISGPYLVQQSLSLNEIKCLAPQDLLRDEITLKEKLGEAFIPFSKVEHFKLAPPLNQKIPSSYSKSNQLDLG